MLSDSVQFQKISIPPRNSEGVRSQKPKFVKERVNANLEFPVGGGGGRVQTQKTILRGGYGYSPEQHNNSQYLHNVNNTNSL